jgi:hypothetical protein
MPLVGQTVTIPDANFKAILVADLAINTNNDLEIQVTEAIAYAGTISVANQGIVNLEGIEAFTNLTVLDCSNNILPSLDISTNVALTSLYCNVCQLPSLDVSNNTNLLALSCYSNQLSSIDVNSNTLMEEFYAYNNQLTNLNMNNQTAIRRFFVQDNQLVTLGFKNGNYMNVTHFNVTSNPTLTCIDVDDVAYSTANWDHIDGGVVFSNNCFTNLDLAHSSELVIYPNPVSADCTIELPKMVSTIELVLYNNLGQKSMHKEYKNTDQINLNLENLDAGIYWLSMSFGERSFQYKIIKSI